MVQLFFLASNTWVILIAFFTCRSPDDPNKSPIHDQRFLFIETRKCSNLGISLVGGNAVGIFVHSVQPDSLAYNSGLRQGKNIYIMGIKNALVAGHMQTYDIFFQDTLQKVFMRFWQSFETHE